MRIDRIVLLGIALVMLNACRHPIEIWGEGDILSATGDRDCLLEDFQAGLANCVENDVTGDYEETYTGVPRAGYQFRRWANYCKSVLTN